MKSRTPPRWAKAPASPSSRVRVANTAPARPMPNSSVRCATCSTARISPGRRRNWAAWTTAAAARWRSFWRPTACTSLTLARPCFPCTAPLNWQAAQTCTPRFRPTAPFLSQLYSCPGISLRWLYQSRQALSHCDACKARSLPRFRTEKSLWYYSIL